MINIVNIEKCDGCATCSDTCPVEVLAVIDGKIRVVDGEMCTDCYACVEVCPNFLLEVLS